MHNLYFSLFARGEILITFYRYTEKFRSISREIIFYRTLYRIIRRYDREVVLGECAEFLLYAGGGVRANIGDGGIRVRVVYGGLGAYCADTINLQVSQSV